MLKFPEKSGVLMKNIAVLASHNGSGFEALEASSKHLNIQICVVITNNSHAPVIEKAKKLHIPTFVINNKTSQNTAHDILTLLEKYESDYIFLSGYMKKLDLSIIKAYKNRIINAHPALLPKFGGHGMYGRFVHVAVIEAKEKTSGVSIHFVDEIYDSGEIILQKCLDVNENETPESLETRVKLLEKEAIVEAFEIILTDQTL